MQSINAEELHKRLTDGDLDNLLIDVREPFEFKARHIYGSKNIPLDKLEGSIDKLKGTETTYVHCQSGGRSANAYKILEKGGINVVDIDGGILAMEQAGFHTEGSDRNIIPIIRQVMIVSGTLVISGVVLGIYVNEWWYFLSGLVGTGLLFAGITSICSMTSILKRMPWNKT